MLQADPARSSGVVNVEPEYTYSLNFPTCTYVSRTSVSKMPLGDGPTVGYREVTVWHGANGEQGKTRHTFRSVLSPGAADPVPQGPWPFSTRTSNAWKRGQTLEVTERSGSDQTQRRVASTHVFRDEGQPEPATTRKLRGLSTNWFSLGYGTGIYVYNPFEVISAWTYQDSDTTVVYDMTGMSSFSTVRNHVYDNPNHVLAAYGPEGRAARGYRQRTHARVIALEDARGERVVFAVVDLAYVSASLHREVVARIGACVTLTGDRIVISTTSPG